MRKYILLVFCLAQSFPAWACGGGSENDRTIRFYRENYGQNRKCTNLILEFPSSLYGMYPRVDIESDTFTFYMGRGGELKDKKNRSSLQMCLSEKILKNIVIDITYFPISKDGKISFCMELIKVDNLSELLAQSDQEAAANK